MPWDSILDRNLTMWYLDLSWHRSLSWYLSLSCYSSSSSYLGLAYLSCRHSYVYFQFMHVMLPLLVFILGVDRTYQSLWLTSFSFASLSSVPPQVPGRKWCCLVRASYAWRSSCIAWCIAWSSLGHGCFTALFWGIIYEKVFMLLYYCRTGFDVLWCKRL